jgi:hypothetical protein
MEGQDKENKAPCIITRCFAAHGLFGCPLKHGFDEFCMLILQDFQGNLLLSCYQPIQYNILLTVLHPQKKNGITDNQAIMNGDFLFSFDLMLVCITSSG